MAVETTTNYEFPYPDLTQPADVPSDVAALAQKMDLVLKALEDQYLPIGSIAMWGGDTAPPRWALCDGTYRDQVGPFAALYAVIGHKFEIGHGSTSGKFILPDFRSRVPVGPDESTVDELGAGSANILTEDNELGYNGGEPKHTLTIPEMPSHHHNISPFSLTPNFSPAGAGNGYTIPAGNTDTANTGGGSPHNNVQPYLVVNYIIRYI